MTKYIITIVAMLAIGFLIGALTFPYMINTWLIYFGKEAVVTWWQGGLLGFVPGLGQVGIPGAVVTWIAMMFL